MERGGLISGIDLYLRVHLRLSEVAIIGCPHIGGWPLREVALYSYVIRTHQDQPLSFVEVIIIVCIQEY